MGVLLMSEGVHARVDLDTGKSPNDNNNENGVRNANGEMPPPPKKKWIRHYLLEEEPSEVRTNGVYAMGTRRSPTLSNSYRGTSAASNSSHMTVLHSAHTSPHQFHHMQNNHESGHDSYLDNHASSNSQAPSSLNMDVDSSSQDGKKSRNGACVIRSGTREVHNKLEKNRRAHLKECFELLKRQLPQHDEKKSSNLSILHAAIKHIQSLKKKEKEFEHEMERLAREKITAQQRLGTLRKESTTPWDHMDFGVLFPENNANTHSTVHSKNVAESMETDIPSLPRGGTRYSSTSSLSSAATASSPQNHQSASSTTSTHNQVATATVVCQTQGLNLAPSSRESPPVSANPPTSASSIPTMMAPEKIAPATPTIIHHLHQPQHQQQQQQPQIQQQQQQQQIAPNQQQHQLHLPINAQMLSTSQGLATIVPTLQHIGSGLRVIPGDTRQLLVQPNPGGNESRPVTLVVHSPANDNRVTFVQASNLANSERGAPLALTVQSSTSNEAGVRPMTFVHSGTEARGSLVLTTATAANSATLNANNGQARLRTTAETPTTHKMVGGVTLVGSDGAEYTALAGGAELSIFPTNGVFPSLKTQSSTIPGEGMGAHLLYKNQPMSDLVAPLTMLSRGKQVRTHIIGPSKVISSPIIKTVSQVPLVSAQYLNTLVKPVVVVTSPSTPTPTTTSPTSSNQQQNQHYQQQMHIQQQQQQNSSVPHSSIERNFP